MEKYYTNIQNTFKLPIEYIEHKRIHQHILDDLELTGGKDNIIKNIYDSSNNFLNDKLTMFYTDKLKYLKDQQKFFKMKDCKLPLLRTRFIDKWKSFVNETSFKEKYSFVEWEHLEFCNHSSQCMQIISVYNLMSPVISLLVPIIFLLFPFFLLKCIQKVPITFAAYKNILIEHMKFNVLGQVVQQFSYAGNYDKKIYVLMGLAFYIFTIYQNILLCLKFYNNVKRIKEMLYDTKQHISHYINICDMVKQQTSKLKTFDLFNVESNRHREKLMSLYENLDFIRSPEFSFGDVNSFGSLLSCFYTLYNSPDYNESLSYSFGFLEYAHFIESMREHINSKKINLCKFSKKKTDLISQFYLPLIHTKHTKNSMDLRMNHIITGPNASGKTTLLKSTLINIILSQQYGFGCYKKARIHPYQSIMCYLNIPDTSERDSLFQAEARRCLDIVNEVKKTRGRSICIFDELYSGTNPNEAIQAAKAYLSYLETENVSYLLTTHYYELCKLERIHGNIQNIHMETKTLHNGELDFTYIVKKGISNIKGGVNILKQLHYPDTILQML